MNGPLYMQDMQAKSQAGADLSLAYFEHVRLDIEPLLPPSAELIVDVGAGTGRTAAWVQSRYPNSRTVALEGNSATYVELQKNVDVAHIVDLNGDIPYIGRPDLILCLDVLEHLVQPLDALRRLADVMAPNGTMIVSLPNVGHLSVSLPLLAGHFEYQHAGILDRTHLRFFVRRSAIELMNESGFIVRGGVRAGFAGPKSRLLDLLTIGSLRDQLTKQFIMAGTFAKNGEKQGRIRWKAV